MSCAPFVESAARASVAAGPAACSVEEQLTDVCRRFGASRRDWFDPATGEDGCRVSPTRAEVRLGGRAVTVRIRWDPALGRFAPRVAQFDQRQWPCPECPQGGAELHLAAPRCGAAPRRETRLRIEQPGLKTCPHPSWGEPADWCQRVPASATEVYWVWIWWWFGRKGELGPLLVGDDWVAVRGKHGWVRVSDPDLVARHKRALEEIWRMPLTNGSGCRDGGTATIRAVRAGQWRVVETHCTRPGIVAQIDEILGSATAQP